MACKLILAPVRGDGSGKNVLGSVTQYVLDNADLPVLMAH